MADLDRRLAELGRDWDAPPTPDIATRVVTRLTADDRVVRRRPRRAIVALIAALVGAGAIAAIAPAREAILDLFAIGGAEVREVPAIPTFPTVPAPSPVESLDLGEEVTPQRAAAAVAFPLGRPTRLPNPSQTFLRTPPTGGMVSFVWTAGAGLPSPVVGDVRAVLSQFTGRPFLEKLATSGSVERLTIGGEPAVWFSGPKHALIYEDSDLMVGEERGRLVSRALVWTNRGTTYRLEGEFTRERAIAVAESTVTSPSP